MYSTSASQDVRCISRNFEVLAI